MGIAGIGSDEDNNLSAASLVNPQATTSISISNSYVDSERYTPIYIFFCNAGSFIGQVRGVEAHAFTIKHSYTGASIGLQGGAWFGRLPDTVKEEEVRVIDSYWNAGTPHNHPPRSAVALDCSDNSWQKYNERSYKKDDAEMRTASTFAKWDPDNNIWNIKDGQYPRLRWQQSQ